MHSIERSAQEDALLVLFNTAISNLVRQRSGFMSYALLTEVYVQVLFRNNFALSRDVSGLFKSFQSSATVLDPAANPDLFRSMLVIVIKVSIQILACSDQYIFHLQDVVESDKNEIARE